VGLEGINPDKLIEKVDSLFDDADKNTLDGVKFTWFDKWVHLRKSNTEPIIRIYAEAPDKAQAADLVASIKALI